MVLTPASCASCPVACACPCAGCRFACGVSSLVGIALAVAGIRKDTPSLTDAASKSYMYAWTYFDVSSSQRERQLEPRIVLPLPVMCASVVT
eukprot:4944263-Prorocentrum_lima.AAC.1